MFCRTNGIQHIVNVGTGIENKFPDKISYTTVELLDLPEQNLQPGAMLNNFSNLISYTTVGTPGSAGILSPQVPNQQLPWCR